MGYGGGEDRGIERWEYEGEGCLGGWMVKEKGGERRVYLEEGCRGEWLIGDMGGLGGVGEVEGDEIGVRVEMVIGEGECILERVDGRFVKGRRKRSKEREK